MIKAVCPFCVEFDDVESSEFRRIFPRSVLHDRFIKTTDNFICIAGLGAIRPGYLLIIPKIHYRSFASLDPAMAMEAERLKDDLVKLLEIKFSTPIVFEHGSVDDQSLAGGCIDHAHLHLLPIGIDIFPRLSKEFAFKQIVNLLELSDFKNQHQPYLYYERSGKGFAFTVDRALPSQYLRRVIAEEEGKSDEWDWGIFMGEERIIETVNTLRKEFSHPRR